MPLDPKDPALQAATAAYAVALTDPAANRATVFAAALPVLNAMLAQEHLTTSAYLWWHRELVAIEALPFPPAT